MGGHALQQAGAQLSLQQLQGEYSNYKNSVEGVAKVGIKRLWYAEPVTSTEAAAGLTKEEVLAKITAAKEITNVHQDTWGYEESDATVTEYINQLTGRPYYRDSEQQGVPTISFTLGTYSYEDKAALQGGKAVKAEGETEASSWERPDSVQSIEKCIIAQTKTGGFPFPSRVYQRRFRNHVARYGERTQRAFHFFANGRRRNQTAKR